MPCSCISEVCQWEPQHGFICHALLDLDGHADTLTGVLIQHHIFMCIRAMSMDYIWQVVLLQYAWEFHWICQWHCIYSSVYTCFMVILISWCYWRAYAFILVGCHMPMIGYQWIRMGMMVFATMSCIYFILFDMIDGSLSWGFCYCHVGFIELYAFPFYCILIQVDGVGIFRGLCKHLMWLFLAYVIVMGTRSVPMWGYLVWCCQMGCEL